jgi:hypothetical protein
MDVGAPATAVPAKRVRDARGRFLPAPERAAVA